MLTEKLNALISLLPKRPGVYQMKDKDGKIIYIGKAKNLKNRVSQYFLRPQSGKVAAMVSHVDSFDFIVVKSEKEAFILEMNLIQTHYPRYNIMLMDDSHYPYIALKKSDDPVLKIARSSSDKRYFYFGPFPSSSSAYETIRLLNKIYPTRKCKNVPSKPCLYYSMGQCLAPCIHALSEERVSALYSSIKRFLSGDNAEAKAMLKSKIEEASDRLDFEAAMEYKKSLDAIDYVASKQSVEVVGERIARDVFAFAEREGYLSLCVLTYRNGILLGKASFVIPRFGEIHEQASELALQYYVNRELPKEIYARIDGFQEEIESVYDEVKVFSPQEGRGMEMISLAELNARQSLDAHFLTARLEDDKLALLEELGKILGIPVPYRIELFDNSHLQGSSPVGAMVCFINGAPAKKMYRKFHLPEEVSGDDYHSMVDVTSRRYKRLKDEGLAYPDLILADGGITQVRAIEEGLSSSGVSGIPVFGLYKNDRHQTEGLVDRDGRTYPLEGKSPLFFFLMRMQDEVHRFAISFHVQQRGKAMKKDFLDEIPGIGMKRKEALLEHYPTREALLGASLGEFSQLLPKEIAEELYFQLHSEREKE